MKKSLLTFGILACLAATAGAETPELKQTIGVGAGIGAQRYYGTYGDQGSIYGRGFVVYHPLEWLGTRLTAGYGDINNDKQDANDFESDWFSNVGLDLVLQPKMGMGAFRPYLASGVSTTFGTAWVNNSVTGDLDWNFYLPVELGLEYLITPNVSAWAWYENYVHMQEWDKLDGVRSGKDFLDQRDDLAKVGLGVTVRIGLKKDADKDGIPDALDQCAATPKGVKIDLKGCPLDEDKDAVPDYKDKCAATPAAAAGRIDTLGCPTDADKDGVFDYLDKCAATPTGVRVDAAGCPLDADKDGVPDFKDKCAKSPTGFKVDATGCTIDSDKDGVSDDKDKCAATQVGTKVDAMGCPVAKDTDKDGVIDDNDKCPGTKVGDKVDSTGCTIIVIEKGKKLTLDGIIFKSGSSKIDALSAPVLARAAVALAKAPEAKVEIAGFTDNKGKASVNKKLSQNRANAVKAYLVKLGANPAQLTAVGYGSAEPVADNATAEGREVNRRIEFRVK